MQKTGVLGAALPGHGVLDVSPVAAVQDAREHTAVRSRFVRQVLSAPNRGVLPGRLDIWTARRPNVCMTFENRK